MNEAFDIAAKTYDDVFTHSHIGKLQRNLVHDFLKKTLPKNQNIDILEINCGTGYDAIWLSNLQHRVIATDISSEMIQIARLKNQVGTALEFQKLDINSLNTTKFDTSFDLIFSNFGGLNCLSQKEIQAFFSAAEKKLKPGGRIIGVIMPKNCIFENLYFLLKGNAKKAFRRNTTKAVPANVDGNWVDTWYYNPKRIKKLSHKAFECDAIQPIGFCIPPSYVEPFFRRKLGLLKVLQNLDFIFNSFSFVAKYSDHYLISLSKKR